MPQKRVYIVSYPRSGNSWVRLLLEHSLGFETKSVYTAYRGAPFNVLGAEHLTREPTLDVLKTHASSLAGDDDVVYVLRDGRDATVSYWHYSRDSEGRRIDSFSEFLRSLALRESWWAFHVHSWLGTQHPHRLLLVRYEDLMKDQEQELARILDFLGLQPIRPFSDYAARVSFENLHAHLPTFYRSGRVGAWRELFSRDDERFFLAHDLGYLTSLGYEREEENTTFSPASADLRSDLLFNCALRRSTELERELEQKEKVIRDLHTEAERRREKLEELDRTFRQAGAEWAGKHEALSRELRVLQSKYDALFKSPVRYFRKVWQHLTSRRQGESE